MARRGYAVRQAVARVGQEITERAWTIGRDPKEEAKMRRRWGLLEGALSAAFTVLARRVAARAWDVLTGEPPPHQRPRDQRK